MTVARPASASKVRGTGVPRQGPRLRTHPSNLIWVIPAKGVEMDETPAWGIEPVPERLRVLGFLDSFLLWGNLSVSLLVIVAGALLVPALSLKLALLAIVVGAVFGNLMLGFAGAIGANARVPGMVVLRAPLGPIGFVRRYVRKFAVWAVLVSLVYLTWWVLDKSHLHAFWHARGKGGISLGSGIDIVIGSIVSWTPLAADYTRFSRDRRSAFWGTAVGYFLPTLWCFGLG